MTLTGFKDYLEKAPNEDWETLCHIFIETIPLNQRQGLYLAEAIIRHWPKGERNNLKCYLIDHD